MRDRRGYESITCRRCGHRIYVRRNETTEDARYRHEAEAHPAPVFTIEVELEKGAVPAEIFQTVFDPLEEDYGVARMHVYENGRLVAETSIIDRAKDRVFQDKAAGRYERSNRG